MTNENASSVVPLRPPWREQLLGALTMVQHKLLLVGPYIKDDVIILLKQTLIARAEPHPLEIRIITRTLPDDFLRGASDLQALQHLLSWSDEFPSWSVEIRSVNNVHAKVWVFDSNLAIVGSGNATFSGLERNLEYGIIISESQLVEQILQDWQNWWEEAMPVDSSVLATMQRWLDEVNSDEEVLLAEALVKKKRSEIENRIGKAPQIGKRLAVSGSNNNVRRTTINESPVPYHKVSNNDLAPNLKIGPANEIIPIEAIRVSAFLFWQALCWCAPVTCDGNPLHIETFFKLALRVISPGTYTLQCTWADGLRFSQATLPGDISGLVSPWAITLKQKEIQQFVNYVQQSQTTMLENNKQPSSGLLLWLQPSPSQLMVFLESMKKNEPIGFASTLSNMPGNFPTLRMPHSQISVDQCPLDDALIALRQDWKILHPTFPLPATLELAFGSVDARSIITLALGSIDDPLIRIISGIDPLIDGPEVRLRLDFAALQHVVIIARERVHRWQLRVGREAEAMQLIPEFTPDLDDIDSQQMLFWRHELRNRSV